MEVVASLGLLAASIVNIVELPNPHNVFYVAIEAIAVYIPPTYVLPS